MAEDFLDGYFSPAPVTPRPTAPAQEEDFLDGYLTMPEQRTQRTGIYADRVTPERRAAIEQEARDNSDYRVADQIESGIQRVKGNLARTGAEVRQRMGLPVPEDTETYIQEQRIRSEALQKEANFTRDWKDIKGVGDVASYASGQLLQSAPEIAATILNPVAGVVAATGSYTGSNLEAQIDEGNETNLLFATGAGVGQAVLDRVAGIERVAGGAIKGLFRGTGRPAGGELARRIVGGAASEGLQEGAQQALEEAARYTVAGESYDALAAVQRVGEATVGGAIVGGVANPILSSGREASPTPSADPNAAATGAAPTPSESEPLFSTNNQGDVQGPQRISIEPDMSGMRSRNEVSGTPFMQFNPEAIRTTIRGDAPTSKDINDMVLYVNDAVDSGDTLSAYKALQTLEMTFNDKLANKKPPSAAKQDQFNGALARSMGLLRQYEAYRGPRPAAPSAPAATTPTLAAIPTITPPVGPTVQQMAGPGVPIDPTAAQASASSLGFAPPVSRETTQLTQAVANAQIAQAQAADTQAQAQQLEMFEKAIPEAERLAKDQQAAQEDQAAQAMADKSRQLSVPMRQELLDSIIKGPRPDATPLQTFMRGLKKIDPEGLPTPAELQALATYSSLSYPEKVKEAEKQKPLDVKLTPKAPQNADLLEPVSVPAKTNKRQLRAQQARAEATALVPEAQQTPEIKSMLTALESAAKSIDETFKSLLNSAPTEGEQLSLFPGEDVRVSPAAPKGFRQYVNNRISAQDAKFEKQLAEMQAAVKKLAEAQPTVLPAQPQEKLFTEQKRPTKQALGTTNDQVRERIELYATQNSNGDTNVLAKQLQLRRLEPLVGRPGVNNADLQKIIASVTNPATSKEDAKFLIDTAMTAAASLPAAPVSRETTVADTQIEEAESESAVLDEENPGVNPGDAALMPLSPAAKVRVLERGLAEALNMWTAGWKNAPVIELFDPNNPRDPRAAEFYKYAPFAGLYDRETKKIFMNIYAFENATDFGGTLYHEALGHYGLDQLYGKRRNDVLMQIYRGNPEVRREAAALQKKSGVSFGNELENQLYYTEEVLVNRFNEGKLELSPTFWQKIRDLITTFARKMGMPSRQYTNAELIATLHAARDTVINGRPTPTPTRPSRSTFGQRFAAQPLAAAPRQPVGQEIVDAFKSSDALNKFLLSKGVVNSGVRRVAITARDYMQRSRLVTMMGNTFADYAEQLGLTDFARIDEIKQTRDALLNQKRLEIDNLMTEADRLGGREPLQQFMYEYTMGRKHGFVPSFYSAEDKAAVRVDPEAKAKVDAFAKSNPDEHAMMLRLMEFAYAERQAYQDAINKYIEGEADEALKDKGLTQKEIADIQDRRSRQLKMFNKSVPKLDGPYFPLSRFGEHMVVAESAEFRALQAKDVRTPDENRQLEAMESDPNHYQVHFFESKGEAELKRADIAAQKEFSGPGARVTNAVKTEFFEQQGESPLLQMQKLRQMVLKELPDTSFDRETKRQIDTLLSDLYIRSLAETSARKFDNRRRNVAGASTDMLKSFHDKMKADAASRAYVTTFSQEMAINKTLYDQVNKDPLDPQYEAKRDFLREMQARSAQSIRLDLKANELQNKIMLASSVYYLFTMPRYYFQNALQPVVYTLPQLAARHTPTKAVQAMLDIQRASFKSVFDKDFFSGKIDLDKLGFSKDETDFLRSAQQAGKLEFGQQMDFGEWRASSQVGRWANWLTHKLRTASGQIEYMNRTVAGVAAYRLERARGASPEAATKYALRMIDKTQLNYSTGAQSRAFNMLPKVVTQFRKYQVGMLALQYGMIKNAVQTARKDGLSAAETQEAMKALAYSWGTIGAVAGAAGLPGMQLAAVMGAYMFGDDDEPLNGERWLRGKFSDDEMGLALRKGVFALMGLDMSNVGLGTILNPLPFFDYSRLGETGGGAQMLGSLAGPAASAITGIAEKTYQGGIADGAYQALPTGLRALQKGYATATEGLERKNGDIVMTPEEIGIMKSVLQGLGFRDLDAAEKMTRYYETVAAEEYYRDRVSEMKREYAEAQDANNADAMQNLMSEWRAMNAAKLRFNLKATPISELFKARADRAKRVADFRQKAGLN